MAHVLVCSRQTLHNNKAFRKQTVFEQKKKKNNLTTTGRIYLHDDVMCDSVNLRTGKNQNVCRWKVEKVGHVR